MPPVRESFLSLNYFHFWNLHAAAILKSVDKNQMLVLALANVPAIIEAQRR
jgi:hypothetical protein